MKYAFQLDLARRLERPETAAVSIENLLRNGYRCCVLYLEDAYSFPDLPGLGRKNAWTPEAIRSIAAICERYQAELMPVIPTLGHCKYITSKPGFEIYDEGYGTGKNLFTLVAGEEATYELLTRMIGDWCGKFAGSYFHIGLDESPMMGRKFIREHGRETFDAPAMFAAHANRVNAIVKSFGRRTLIWGDMLYYFPEAADLLDKDIIVVDWFYHPFDNLPRIEQFNFAELDSSGPLRARGFEVWGCASVWPNLPFPKPEARVRNLESWVRYSKKHRMPWVLNTDWENSLGFFDFAELVMLLGIKCSADWDYAQLPARLAEILGGDFAIADAGTAAGALIELGEINITGYQNGKYLHRGVLSLISSFPERIEEYRTLHNRAAAILARLGNLTAANDRGRRLLAELRAVTRFLYGFGRGGEVLSEAAKLGVLQSDTVAAKLAMVERLWREVAVEYDAVWKETRFPGEFLFMDAGRKADELKAIICELKNEPQHARWFSHGRLELKISFDHPALQLLGITLEYADGSTFVECEAMIRFDEDYATPERSAVHYASIALDSNKLPAAIRLSNSHYGQFTIEEIRLTADGKVYQPFDFELTGAHAREKDGRITLGPIRSYPTDPTHRADIDLAVGRFR